MGLPQDRDGMRDRDESQHDSAVYRWAARRLARHVEEGTSAARLYDLLKPHVTKLVVCDPRKNASKGRASAISNDKRASDDRWIAGEKPTSRD